ncbi:MAG: hypothetical protein H0W50_08740 [Parachlamydiaceae bacterium]|nr:hypothetical protein [Parachlamydiaceae bacterium]
MKKITGLIALVLILTSLAFLQTVKNDIVNNVEFKKNTNGTETFHFKYTEEPLNKVVKQLGQQGPIEQKKAVLMKQGLDQLHKLSPKPSDIHVTRFIDPSVFKLTYNKKPEYFCHIWSGNEDTEVTTIKDFFDYSQNDYRHIHIYTCFANQKLGGGWKTHGFVQEEIIAYEIPGYAALLAHTEEQKIPLMTRNPNRENSPEGTFGGSPNPLIIQGLSRVQIVDANSTPYSKAYGAGIYKISQKMLLETTAKLNIPQDVTLLAIAAPQLKSQDPSIQYSQEALEDSFNTLVAGATLAQTTFVDPNRKLLIH